MMFILRGSSPYMEQLGTGRCDDASQTNHKRKLASLLIIIIIDVALVVLHTVPSAPADVLWCHRKVLNGGLGLGDRYSPGPY